MTVKIISTTQMNLACDCGSVGHGPGTSSESSPRPGGSWGDDKYLLHIDQAVVVTVIISAISVGVMLVWQVPAALPHGRRSVREANAHRGWAARRTRHRLGFQVGVSAIWTPVLGAWNQGTLASYPVSTVLSPRYIGVWRYRRGVLWSRHHQITVPQQEGSSTVIGSEWVMG